MKKVASIQMTSSSDLKKNLTTAAELIRRAADQGAALAVLPEMFALMGVDQFQKVKLCEQEATGEIQLFLSEQAKEAGIWLVGGTIPLASGDPQKVRAACIVYNAQGVAVARYDKIHLFDATISQGEEIYKESRTTQPGTEVVVVDTPVGCLGLGVCYDLRFPELFRSQVLKGVEVFALPAAFALTTGQVHWDVLMRARAIENLAYVIGSSQQGTHDSGRQTHGHSMIINPWGDVLDILPEGQGIAIAEIDLDFLREVRRCMPVIDHQQLL